MDEKRQPPPGTPALSLRASLILPPLPIFLSSHFSSCCRPCRCLFFSLLPAPLISPQRESSCSSRCPTSLTSVALPSPPLLSSLSHSRPLPSFTSSHPNPFPPYIFGILPDQFRCVPNCTSSVQKLFTQGSLKKCVIRNVFSNQLFTAQSMSYCWHCMSGAMSSAH